MMYLQGNFKLVVSNYHNDLCYLAKEVMIVRTNILTLQISVSRVLRVFSNNLLIISILQL